jgi:hypothetical protein
MVATNKTQQTNASVDAYLANVEPLARRQDCERVVALMKKITGCAPKMWGPSIIGFDTYHYKYESGREGDHLITGLASRKSALTLYIMDGFDGCQDLMDQLGKFKTGKSCLYLKSLEDVDLKVLEKLIRASVNHMRKKYPKP